MGYRRKKFKRKGSYKKKGSRTRPAYNVIRRGGKWM